MKKLLTLDEYVQDGVMDTKQRDSIKEFLKNHPSLTMPIVTGRNLDISDYIDGGEKYSKYNKIKQSGNTELLERFLEEYPEFKDMDTAL